MTSNSTALTPAKASTTGSLFSAPSISSAAAAVTVPTTAPFGAPAPTAKAFGAPLVADPFELMTPGVAATGGVAGLYASTPLGSAQPPQVRTKKKTSLRNTSR